MEPDSAKPTRASRPLSANFLGKLEAFKGFDAVLDVVLGDSKPGRLSVATAFSFLTAAAFRANLHFGQAGGSAARAARILSGVRGPRRTRAPVASKIALPIAAAVGRLAGSPAPLGAIS